MFLSYARVDQVLTKAGAEYMTYSVVAKYPRERGERYKLAVKGRENGGLLRLETFTKVSCRIAALGCPYFLIGAGEGACSTC
jgi:hypothetical protein